MKLRQALQIRAEDIEKAEMLGERKEEKKERPRKR